MWCKPQQILMTVCNYFSFNMQAERFNCQFLVLVLTYNMHRKIGQEKIPSWCSNFYIVSNLYAVVFHIRCRMPLHGLCVHVLSRTKRLNDAMCDGENVHHESFRSTLMSVFIGHYEPPLYIKEHLQFLK